MPRKIKNKLPPLNMGKKTIGERISLFRKKRGLTQKELAGIIGIERYLVTDYETGRLHLNDEMIIRFSIALNVSADELLGLKKRKDMPENIDFKVTKRLKEIDNLPPMQKKSLLNTIDVYLKANKVKE